MKFKDTAVSPEILSKKALKNLQNGKFSLAYQDPKPHNTIFNQMVIQAKQNTYCSCQPGCFNVFYKLESEF